jgi:hypothetical protein
MTELKLMTMRSANQKPEVIEVEVQRRTNQTEFENADYQTFNETAKNLHSHQHVNQKSLFSKGLEDSRLEDKNRKFKELSFRNYHKPSLSFIKKANAKFGS